MKVFLAGLFSGTLMLPASTAYGEGILADLFPEQDIEVSVSADIALVDKYIWRGFRLDGDKSIQPAFNVGIGPIEGGFWGSFDTQANDSLDSDEVDGWIGISQDLGFIDDTMAAVSVSAGHTWYSFPKGDTGLSQGSHTKEFYAGISVDTFLSPSFTWYHDYENESSGGADGNYYIFSLSHSFTLEDTYGITLDIGEEIGFVDEAFINGDGGYSTTSVGLTIPLTDSVTISPMLAYTVPWGDLEDSNDGNQDDEFWGGITASFSN